MYSIHFAFNMLNHLWKRKLMSQGTLRSKSSSAEFPLYCIFHIFLISKALKQRNNRSGEF